MATDHPTCDQCGYDLHGNTTGRCPECGHNLHDLKRPPGNPMMLVVILGIILCSMVVMFPVVWYLNRYLLEQGF